MKIFNLSVDLKSFFEKQKIKELTLFNFLFYFLKYFKGIIYMHQF
jgi:hypothetical protein